MKTRATLLREIALALPLLLLVGSLIGGSEGALAVGLSGLVALVNVAALAVVADCLVRAGSTGQGAGLTVALLLAKMALLLGAYALLLVYFPPLFVALGLTLVMAGVLVSGLFGGLHASTPAEEAR